MLKRGKMRKKKAISPLIATVLLIGFTVALATVVMLWAKGYITERAEKEGALSEKQLECTYIDMTVNKAVLSGNVLSLELENKAEKSIDGIIVRTLEDESKVFKKVIGLGPFEVRNINIENIGAIDRVDVIPALKPEGAGAPFVPCSEKHKVVKIIGEVKL